MEEPNAGSTALSDGPRVVASTNMGAGAVAGTLFFRGLCYREDSAAVVTAVGAIVQLIRTKAGKRILKLAGSFRRRPRSLQRYETKC